MTGLEFAKVHNLAIYLVDPPEAHSDFQFIISGLRRCCLYTALTTSPVIYQQLFKEFWSIATVIKDDKGTKYLETSVQGKKVLVTEQILRKTLQISDEPEFSISLATHLAQHSSEPFSSGKWISIEEGHSGDVDPVVSKLKEEIGILNQQNIKKDILIGKHDVRIVEPKADNALKSKQISDSQTNLGSLTSFYFNLKNKLFEAFGDKFQSLFQRPHGIEDPPTAPVQPFESKIHVDQQPPRTTRIVNLFEKYHVNANPRITIKHGNKIFIAEEKVGLVFMKNSNENRKANKPQLTVIDLEKRKLMIDLVIILGSKCGPMIMNLNCGWLREILEIQSTTKAFMTSTPRQKLISLNSQGFHSTILQKILPATNQLKEIPIPQHFHDVYLDDMDFWAIDDETSTAAIKFKNREGIIRLVSVKDILRFTERDIHTLACHQIVWRREIIEASAKEFT
ncbi:unnamed protein product [Lactuca saligna]|uniref:Uncharacterized protein n=1 Tax=Lactuca saligna TaxID=75948 RepID=A0AA35ZVY6_LACSI|nr:unnamed protein product [Lactuca saligna]